MYEIIGVIVIWIAGVWLRGKIYEHLGIDILMIVGERGINRKDAWGVFFLCKFYFFSDNVENRKEAKILAHMFTKIKITHYGRI